ncbi:hypothetical protein [Hufsiella ginkgonis]|uniref:Uncharacterized protein n=1 Tax=Hufsiella ginkgonis TaxID=2695274 RepID=A0A7K1XTG5_9SPHI|nr:hypothetical protein [Hufsiella ginkgonis]MXV14303.1 hypothetical protein [Hufsiella ginkgonis]
MNALKLTPSQTISHPAAVTGQESFPPSPAFETGGALQLHVLEFFQTYGGGATAGADRASGARQRLWHWYRCTVSGEYHLLEPLEMAGLVQFYDALDELLGELAEGP